MIKKALIISICGMFILLSGCASGPDCLTATGDMVVEEITPPPFNAILVNEDIELVIRQGDEYKVRVETGRNLLGDFKAEVAGDLLELSMENTCQIFRGYNTTRVYVTAPDVVELISSTQYAIRSEGVLNYDRLNLRSLSYPEGRDWIVNGEFLLELNVGQLVIDANEFANFEIAGVAEEVSVRLSAGHVRVFMPELMVQRAEVFHRSSLDITLNASEAVTGTLYSTGNLVLVRLPLEVNVVENYKGRVIYP